ncbi:MAG: NAD(P)/FAD-dependent oxidoreductase [Actinomycetota bacterium]|nr:NAD(P)/FAD-dependent oxidoreductase [Actinomycetota bacterium]
MASILILGGGFGGLAAAHELRARLPDNHEVSVVAADDHFYAGFAKLWDLVGARPLEQGTASLSTLEQHGIRFVQTRITSIDPAERRVETEAGSFGADFLLVALGAGSGPGRFLRLQDPAHDLYDANQLPQMRADLAHLDAGTLVVAILGAPYKCPPAPYEAALLLDEHLRGRGARDAIELVVTTPQPMTLPAAGSDISQFVADALEDRDIELRTEQSVQAIDTSTVSFADGGRLEYALLLAVPQAVPPQVVADSPLAGEGGWIQPDRETLLTRFERVYAAGDCTASPPPKAGIFAESEARVAARNIAAEIDGSPGDRFDGTGYCFLEFPGQRASALEGHFLAQPPEVRLAEPDTETFARKQAFEAERLRDWLDVGLG